MLLAIEPLFSDHTHAHANACLLEAIALGCGDEPVAVAANPNHYAHVLSVRPGLGSRLTYRPIEVEAPGGITYARFQRHMRVLLQHVREFRPACVVCLAVAPETLFACAVLRLRHPHLPIVAVLHGTAAAAGWRSRDPRHRWFDHRSAIRVAVTAGIRFVVLESYIKHTAVRLKLVPDAHCDVWPHPILEDERVGQTPDLRSDCLWLGFLGFAKRQKGFDDFLAMADSAASRGADWCRFRLVGALADRNYEHALANVTIVPNVVERANFVAAVRALDYACMFLPDETYRLTSSGSLLDAVAALRPIIGLDTPAMHEMFQETRVGYLCRTLDELNDLIANPQALFDVSRYRGFQEGLRAFGRGRSPMELAQSVAATIRKAVMNGAR